MGDTHQLQVLEPVRIESLAAPASAEPSAGGKVTVNVTRKIDNWHPQLYVAQLEVGANLVPLSVEDDGSFVVPVEFREAGVKTISLQVQRAEGAVMAEQSVTTEVVNEAVTKPTPPAGAAPGNLPTTGAEVILLGFVGLALVAGGAALLGARRRSQQLR